MTTFEDDITYYMVKSLVVVIGTLGMMSSCMKVKYKLKKILITFVVYLAWVGLFTFVTMKFLGIVATLRLCIPMISVPAIVILYFMSTYSPWQAIFNYTMQLSVSVILAMTQTIAVTVLGGGKAVDLLIRLLSYSLLIFAEYKFLRKKFSLLNYLPDKSWRSLTFVPIGFTLLLFLIGTYPVHYTESVSHTIYIYAVTAVMLLIYVIIFHSLVSQYNLQLSEYTNSILTSQSESFQKQLEAINSTEEQLKIMRHNMRYHIIVVSDMLAAGDNSGALKYLGDFEKRLDDAKKTIYCSNSTANAILAYYIERAESKGISTEVQFAMPENMDIDIIDFTAALANALENAVNACAKVPDNQGRLCIRTTEAKQYIVEVANNYTGKVLFDEEGLPTSKESGHGIGTRSISAFAKKNNAILDYDITDEWFRLRLVLPNSEKQPDTAAKHRE
ncbi:MAG: GHKL domain-containing protein [Oscillospiraceae bacterium]|nr:GHKL domain-containing protein [Oscillospiraceae bacterium]